MIFRRLFQSRCYTFPNLGLVWMSKDLNQVVNYFRSIAQRDLAFIYILWLEKFILG